MTCTEKYLSNGYGFLSKWIRGKLPESSTGYMVSDIDFVLYNYKTKTVMLIETKSKGSQIPVWQKYKLGKLEYSFVELIK